jgi:hypothetical protein
MRAFVITVLGASMLGATMMACSGSDGATGPSGPDGKQGAMGLPGATGPMGAMGATGATGAMGTSAAGAGGSGGAAGAAGSSAVGSISLVSPTNGLLGNEEDVIITGAGTTFDATTTIDFGAKVTVSNIQVASPTSLLAHIAVGVDADLGARDVTVKTGTQALTWSKAFKILPPMEIDVLGTAQQGALLSLNLKDNDPNTAFDTASLAVSAPDTFPLSVAASSGSRATALLLVDPAAPVGPLAITANNTDANGNPTDVFISDPKAVTLAARMPQALTLPATQMDSLASPADSKLYSATATGAVIVAYTLSVTDPAAVINPLVAIIPASGHVKDGLAFIQAPIDPTDPFGGTLPPPYNVTESVPNASGDLASSILVCDLAGGGAATGYGFSMSVTAIPATVVPEQSATHGVPMDAQDITASLPAVITGKLDDASQIDTYVITGAKTGDNYEIAFAPSVAGEAGIPAMQPTGADLTSPIMLDPINNGDTVASVDTTMYLAHTDTQVYPVSANGSIYLVVDAAGSASGAGTYTVSIRKVQLRDRGATSAPGDPRIVGQHVVCARRSRAVVRAESRHALGPRQAPRSSGVRQERRVREARRRGRHRRGSLQAE